MKMHGGNLPVMLADKDSTNVMCLINGAFVVSITDVGGNNMNAVLVSNLCED